MVKAGVFLLARMSPLLGGTEAWSVTLVGFGAVTAVYSALVSVTRTDLKQVLAYTTVMALGTCVMFLGLPGQAAGHGAFRCRYRGHGIHPRACLVQGCVVHGCWCD